MLDHDIIRNHVLPFLLALYIALFFTNVFYEDTKFYNNNQATGILTADGSELLEIIIRK